jgi:hypothetical protein
VVRVVEPAHRVVVEDVRTGARAVLTQLDAVGPQIARWLEGRPDPPAEPREDQR